jgi:acetyl-CoA C-acetyltransferase
MTDAYIYDTVRTPRGKGRPDGALHEVTSVRLSAGVLNALKSRNDLSGHAVEDVIWGNVTQVGEQGGCLARTAVLASDLDERIPGLAINRFCASGMEAVNLAANQIRGGAGQAYIAGGVEMMGRVAMGSDGAAIAADPSLAMETYFVPQGISADIIATEYGFTRDDADALAVESQRRAKAAWDAGRFARSSSLSATRTVCRSCPPTNTCARRPTCRPLVRSSPPSRISARGCPASTRSP